MFERFHRQTGERIIGTWAEICDLDVRLWTHAKAIDNAPKLPVILAKVETVTIDHGLTIHATMMIFDHKQLIGMYLGG